MLFHNPSSPHALGIKAERAMRDARKSIATALCMCDKSTQLFSHASNEIIFTSGGTESNNLAILGYALANIRNSANLISFPYEHPSILAPIQFAQQQGWADTKTNMPGAALVSISHVNHETGDINDINAISAEIKKKNPDAIIHVDGAQGFCKEKICLSGIDIYTFSGHKFHGPVGIGGLWVKKGIRLTPLQHGGGQEGGLRSGTENVSAIVQMAAAADTMSQNLAANHSKVAKIKEKLMSLQDALPNVVINNLCQEVSPYILNMSFLGVKGEILVHALSEKGVYVSMGAACRSRKRAQPALELMGFAPEIAQSAIRFSFSPHNTIEEAEQVRDIVIKTVKQFRKL